MKRVFLIVFTLLLATQVKPQGLVQSVVGRVLDKDAESPLPGVNVIILESNPAMSTSTDGDGYFKVDNVPVGRVGIKFTFVGYKPVEMRNLELTSGKQLVVNPKMEENIVEIETVEVRANGKKDEAMNKMASVSARSLTVEETNRYAGSLGDPSRMAQNFAGVNFGADNRNDIIIRGNSPSGMLWKMDGVTIPSPNHFSSQGSTGGPVSMVNNNLLANSDFFTGAWPAEYGNSVSGVFDLKMRNGNTEKREYLGQVGWNGFELGAEGPFVKGKRASYIINYRYSTLAMVAKMGFNSLGICPYYQDLSTKVNVPTKAAGTFSFTGIAGRSDITLPHTESSSYGNDSLIDIFTGSKMATGILGNNYQFNSKMSMKTFAAVSGLSSFTNVDFITYKQSIDDGQQSWSDDGSTNYLRETMDEIRYQVGIKLNNKISSRDNVSLGLNIHMFNLVSVDSVCTNADFFKYDDQTYINDYRYIKRVDSREHGVMLHQGFVQWQHRFDDQLTLYTGLNGQVFQFNNTWSVDPRASLKYQINEKQSVKIGYGLHSQLQPMFVYITESTSDSINYVQTNKNLGMTKSHHVVLGYDYLIADNLRFKAEAYFQYLYDVPVLQMSQFLIDHKDDPAYCDEYLERASVSLSNYGADFYMPRFDSLVNEGTGRNYGLEFTLEKFFTNGFYGLMTLSLFESKYKTPYSGELNTVFNNNVVFNALAGYEYKINTTHSVAVDIKGNYSGGRRRLDIDLQKSIAEGETVCDYSNPYSTQYRPYFRFDVKLSYKKNARRYTEEFSLDLQNITNHDNMMLEQFSYNRLHPSESEITEVPQMKFFVMPTFRITF